MRKLISILVPYKIIKNNIYFWMQTRQSTDEFNFLLEFPGGKIEATETPKSALLREVKEEVGLDLTDHKEQIREFKTYDVSLSDKNISLYVFVFEDNEEKFDQLGYHLIPPDTWRNFENSIPWPNRQIFEDLHKYLIVNEVNLI